MLKGLIDDTYGGIQDDFTTPLPFITVNEGGVKFLIYYPALNDYEKRVKHTNPVVDIVLHLVDIKDTTSSETLEQNLEDDLMILKHLRFKELVIGFNKMDTAKWEKTVYNEACETVKSKLSTIGVKSWHNTHDIKSLVCVAVSTKHNINIVSSKADSEKAESAGLSKKAAEGSLELTKTSLMQSLVEVG